MEDVDRSVLDLLAFHAKNYADVKSEYEELKTQLSSDHDPAPPAQATELSILSDLLEKQYTEERDSEKRLQDLINTFGCRGRVEDFKSRRTAAEKEAEHLNARLEKILDENHHLRNLITGSQLQTRILAADIRARRREEINKLYPPMNHVQDSFVPEVVYFKEWPAAVFKTLYPHLANSVYVCLLPSPPATFPLSIPRAAQSSYCFHPFWSHPPGIPFEFIVEGLPGEWVYLGRYATSWIPGYDMTISEWLAMSEEVKSIYIRHLAARWSETPPGANGSVVNPDLNNLAEMRSQYDCGALKVPCYALQCLGFNMEFYNALPAVMKSAEMLAAQQQQGRPGPPPSQMVGPGVPPRPISSRSVSSRSVSNPPSAGSGVPPESLLLAPVPKRSISALEEREDAADMTANSKASGRKPAKQRRGASNPEKGK